MLPGPLFYFDLLTAARRARPYWIRAFYGLALLAMLWSEYPDSALTSRGLSLSQVANYAQNVFGTFVMLQLLLVLAVGPALVAPAISVERERRTIEYLFATDLSNAEIVLGKLLSRMLHLAAYVAVGMPILALAGLLGGVDTGQLLMSFAITGSTMAAVGSLALMVSVCAAKVRDALATVYLLLIALLLPPPILSGIGAQWSLPEPVRWIVSTLVEANPLWALTLILGGPGGFLGPSGGWPVVEALARDHLLFAAATTALACWSVRRVHLSQSGRSANKRRIARATRGKPVGSRPIQWKEFRANRFGGQSLAARIVLAIVGAGYVAGIGALYWRFHGIAQQVHSPGGSWVATTEFSQTTRVLLTVLTFAVLLLIASRAGSCVTTERERETWLTLLSTPVSAREILWGKFLGNLYAARIAVWLWLVAMIPVLIDDPAAAFALPFIVATTLILASFVSALGTYCSLKLKTTLRAQATTLGVAVFIGGGYMYCCAPLAFGFFRVFAPDAEAVALTLCMPFLAWKAYDFSPGSYTSQQDFVYIAVYSYGNAIYLAATVALLASGVSIFDKANGRVVDPELDARGVLPDEVAPAAGDGTAGGVADSPERPIDAGG